MKHRLFFTLTSLFITLPSFAQLNIFSDLKARYAYDKTTKQWSETERDESKNWFFIINDEFTRISHLTNTKEGEPLRYVFTCDIVGKSAKKEGKSKGEETYILQVECGTEKEKYTVVWDLESQQLKFINNEATRMTNWVIAKTWLTKNEKK